MVLLDPLYSHCWTPIYPPLRKRLQILQKGQGWMYICRCKDLLLLDSFSVDDRNISCSEVVITLDFESSIPGSNPGKRIFAIYWCLNKTYLCYWYWTLILQGYRDFRLFTTPFTAHICMLVSLSWYTTRWADIWVYTASPVICITTALLLTTIFIYFFKSLSFVCTLTLPVYHQAQPRP